MKSTTCTPIPEHESARSNLQSKTVSSDIFSPPGRACRRRQARKIYAAPRRGNKLGAVETMPVAEDRVNYREPHRSLEATVLQSSFDLANMAVLAPRPLTIQETNNESSVPSLNSVSPLLSTFSTPLPMFSIAVRDSNIFFYKLFSAMAETLCFVQFPENRGKFFMGNSTIHLNQACNESAVFVY